MGFLHRDLKEILLKARFGTLLKLLRDKLSHGISCNWGFCACASPLEGAPTHSTQMSKDPQENLAQLHSSCRGSNSITFLNRAFRGNVCLTPVCVVPEFTKAHEAG